VEFWRSVLDVLNAPITEIGGKTLTPLAVIQIGVIITLALVMRRLVNRALREVLQRRPGVSGAIAGGVLRTTRWFVLLLGGYLALTSVGFDLGVLLALIGGLSVGIGFGLQQIANNLVAGAIVLGERQIQVGTEVEVRGFRGRVERLATRSVHLRLDDGQRVILASSMLLSDPVKIYDALGSGRA